MKKHLLTGILSLLIMVAFGQSTLTILNTGIETPLYGCDFIDENNGIVVGDIGTILRTADGGATWESIQAGVTTMLNAVNYADQNTVIIAGNQGLVMRSADGGSTWTSTTIPDISAADLLCIDIDETGTGVIGGTHNTILATTDGGLTWDVVQAGMLGAFYSVRMYDGNNAWFFGVNAITETYITRLESLTDISFTHRYRIYNGNYFSESKCFDAYVFSADSFLMAGCQISASYPGWQAYITRNGNLEEVEWYADYTRDSAYFLGLDLLENHVISVGGRTVSGKRAGGTPMSLVCESFDQGITWDILPVTTGCDLYDVKVLDKATYIVGDSGRILKATPPVSVRDNQTALHGLNIYPNPVKETLNCVFSVSANERVDITLFSPEGKRIRNLWSGIPEPGNNNLQFLMSGLAPGIYYLTLSSARGIETMKVCITR